MCAVLCCVLRKYLGPKRLHPPRGGGCKLMGPCPVPLVAGWYGMSHTLCSVAATALVWLQA
jgi:hypothetical protein